MLKKLFALIVMLGLFSLTVGCEAEGEIDGNGGGVELEIDER